MTAALVHPSLHGSRPRRSPRPTDRRAVPQADAARALRRGRRLGVCEAWRLLSDDPPSFGDDD